MGSVATSSSRRSAHRRADESDQLDSKRRVVRNEPIDDARPVTGAVVPLEAHERDGSRSSRSRNAVECLVRSVVEMPEERVREPPAHRHGTRPDCCAGCRARAGGGSRCRRRRVPRPTAASRTPACARSRSRARRRRSPPDGSTTRRRTRRADDPRIRSSRQSSPDDATNPSCLGCSSHPERRNTPASRSMHGHRLVHLLRLRP